MNAPIIKIQFKIFYNPFIFGFQPVKAIAYLRLISYKWNKRKAGGSDQRLQSKLFPSLLFTQLRKPTSFTYSSATKIINLVVNVHTYNLRVLRGCSYGDELARLVGLASLGEISRYLRTSYKNIMHSYDKWGSPVKSHLILTRSHLGEIKNFHMSTRKWANPASGTEFSSISFVLFFRC